MPATKRPTKARAKETPPVIPADDRPNPGEAVDAIAEGTATAPEIEQDGPPIDDLGPVGTDSQPVNTGSPEAVSEAAAVIVSEDETDADPAFAMFPNLARAVIDDDPTSAVNLASYDEETRALVDDAEKAASAAESDYEAMKKETSEAKKLLEIRQTALTALIRTRRENRGKRPEQNLFSGVAGEVPNDQDDDDPDGEPTETPIANANPDPELWREFPIGSPRWKEWGLTTSDIEKLHAGEIKNGGCQPIEKFGDVSRFCKPSASGWARTLADLKGFGPKSAERWAAAEVKFWAWWQSGGEAAFAAEKGVTLGNATFAGDGAELPRDGVDDRAGPGDAEPVDGGGDFHEYAEAVAEQSERADEAKYDHTEFTKGW